MGGTRPTRTGWLLRRLLLLRRCCGGDSVELLLLLLRLLSVVRSGSWLSIPLKLCLLPSSCNVSTEWRVSKANGAGCIVDINAGTAARCSLGGTRCLLSGCQQYPDPL